MSKPKYDEPLPRYGHVMTIQDFKEHCREGDFIDSDGSGHPVKDNKVCGSITVYPSTLHEIPDDATHVVWFNK